MKITIELPDEFFRKAEAIAASRGQSLEQFIVQLILRETGDPDAAEGRGFALSEEVVGRNGGIFVPGWKRP